MNEQVRILVVDDEESIRGILNETLSMLGYEIIEASSAEEALKELKAHRFDLVMSDIRMAGLSGIQLLERIKGLGLDPEVIIMTSNASLETALEAIRLGAYDYLLKPFEALDYIATVVNRAVERRRLASENRRLMEDFKNKNEELSQATKRAATLLTEAHTFSQKMIELFSSPTMEEAGQRMVEVLSHLMRGRPAVLFEHSADTGELVGRKAAGMERNAAADLRLKIPGVPRLSDWFEKQEYVPLLKELFQTRFGSGILGAQLISESGESRVLVVSEGLQGPFSPREKEMLDHFAIVAARALDQSEFQPNREAAERKPDSERFRDDPTGFFGIAYFRSYLEQEVARSRRYRHPFSLCLFSIHGPSEGPEKEKAIREVAELIRKRARVSDLVGRWGERFFLLLPETDKAWGEKVVKSLKRKMEECTAALRGSVESRAAIVEYPLDADSATGLMDRLEAEVHSKERSGSLPRPGLEVAKRKGMTAPEKRPAPVVEEIRPGEPLVDFKKTGSGTDTKETEGPGGMRRILVVDDEKTIRDLLQEALTEHGYEVGTAGSAHEAWLVLSRERFDLILLDIRMQGVSGLDLLKVVKTKNLPTKVLIMTAHHNEQLAKNAIAMGACGYFLKPFDDLRVLIKQVGQVVGSEGKF